MRENDVAPEGSAMQYSATEDEAPKAERTAKELELQARISELETDNLAQLQAFEAAHIAQTQDKLAELHETIRSLNVVIDAKDAARHELEAQIGDLNARILDLTGLLQAEKLDNQAKRHELHTEIEHLRGEAEAGRQVVTKVAELEFTVREQRRIVGRLDSTSAILETDIARLRSENERLKKAAGVADNDAKSPAAVPRASDYIN